MVDIEQFRDERIRPLHSEEFDRLITTGAFEDERVELIEGVLVAMTPVGDPHIAITARFVRKLILASQHLDVEVYCQSPVRMGHTSTPQPDIAVVARQDGFLRRVGGLLIIEVADSSLRRDRGIKREIYAKAKIPEYWIVDVKHERIEVHTNPRGRGFKAVEVVGRDGVLKPLKLPGVTIVVDELFREQP